MYSFIVKQYYKVKSRGRYASPCQAMPQRTLALSPADVLSKNSDGTYMRISGACVRGIRVPDSDLIVCKQPLMMVVG